MEFGLRSSRDSEASAEIKKPASCDEAFSLINVVYSIRVLPAFRRGLNYLNI